MTGNNQGEHVTQLLQLRSNSFAVIPDAYDLGDGFINCLQAFAVACLLGEPAIVVRLIGLGLYPSGNSPDAFASQIAVEIVKMKRIATLARIRIE